MVSALSEWEAVLSRMSPEKKSIVRQAVASKLAADWLPNPGPQTQAYLSKADVLLYGGAAGGGKTDLLLGTALTNHTRTVIFRRNGTDLTDAEDRLVEIIKTRDGYNANDMILRRKGRVIQFGALEKPRSEFSWQGRPHDLIGFDEGAQLSVEKVAFVAGWNRSTVPGQRCRVIIATNPPHGGEGDWLIEWFAPWLDPLYSSPAVAGELRWALTVDQSTVWVPGPGSYNPDGTPWDGVDKDREYVALSRTFIPALLDDNPYINPEYRARIQNMREPLRSQLLLGDFMAGRQDHAWQLIPTEYVKAAQARWVKAEQRRRDMVALAADVALGGNDKIALSALHDDNWFAPMVEYPADNIEDPAEIASYMLKHQKDGADLSVDATGGWGSGVMSNLKHMHKMDCAGIVFSKGSEARAKDGKHTFKNKRAEMYWKFFEALAPDSSEDIKLPPDAKVLAQLTAARYDIRGTDVLVEDKEAIRKRLGSSPDWADAIVMAWSRRKASIRKAHRPVAGLPPLPKPFVPPNRPDAWMDMR